MKKYILVLILILGLGFPAQESQGATAIEFGLIAAQLGGLGIICIDPAVICSIQNCGENEACDITIDTSAPLCFSGVQCVESNAETTCTTDSDCTDPSMAMCGPLGICEAPPELCAADTDCPDPAKPYCDPLAMICIDTAPIDTDGDSVPDVVDLDDDNDGVEDIDDPAPLDPGVCGDIDTDTCDDCSQTGVQDPDNDGPDSDGDGICDAGDTTACDCDNPNAIVEGFPFRGKTYFFGTFGDDIICGSSERDVVFAFGGDDCVDSGDGNDRVFAGFGDDIISLGLGDDRAWGGPGNDDIEGDGGEDSANGGFGEDYCDAETTSRCEVGPEE